MFKFKSARKRKKINFIECKTDIIDTNRISGAHIEIFSNKELVIDGCAGILEYNDDYVKLKLCKGMIILSGSNFDILSFENDVISIKGNILSIEFCL